MIPEKQRDFYYWIFAECIVFLMLRLLTLLTAFDTLSWHEELGIGTVTRELLLGLKAPFLMYQLDYYSGDSLVLSLLLYPFFKFFGTSYWILKMLPLLISFAIFLSALWFITRHFGERAALWTGFFLIFTPPVITTQSLILFSAHYEPLLITLMMLIFFYERLFTGKTPFLYAAAFGFLGGFGFWFYYTGILGFAACLFMWMIVRPKSFFSFQILPTLLFFFAGLIPWFFTNQFHHSDSFHFLTAFASDKIQLMNIYRILRRMARLVLFSLPEAFVFLSKDNFLARPLAYGYYFLSLITIAVVGIKNGGLRVRPWSLGFSAQDDKYPKLLFLIFFPIFFLWVVAMTHVDIPGEYRFAVMFRYYAPVFFFGTLLLGVAVSRAPKILMIPLVVLSLLAQNPIFFQETPGKSLRYKGYSYYTLGTYWEYFIPRNHSVYASLKHQANYLREPESRLALLAMAHTRWLNIPFWWNPDSRIPVSTQFEDVPNPYQGLLAEVVGSFAQVNCKGCTLKELLQRSAQVSNSIRPFFLKGILADFYGEGIREFLEHPEILSNLSSSEKVWAYWGIGQYFQINPLAQEDAENRMIRNFLHKKPEAEAWYYRGIGSAGFSTESSLYLEKDLSDEIKKTASLIPQKYLPDFYWGIGWAFRNLFPDDPLRARDWLEILPQKYQKAAKSGLEACDGWYFQYPSTFSPKLLNKLQ